MYATHELPAGYQKIGTLDISKNQRLLILLNLVGLAAMLIFGFLFFLAILWVRSYSGSGGVQMIQITSLVELISLVAAILVLTVFYVTLHEAIHGLFFWIYTRKRPHFAFRWSYAYASAPDWYIYRNPFLITTLAPLVIISLIGLLAAAIAPSGWLLSIWYVTTMNACGAVGDIAVAIWLLRQPGTCLAQDRGDALTLYNPL